MKLVYFTISGNCKLFIDKIDKTLYTEIIQLNKINSYNIKFDEDYILLCGSYEKENIIYDHLKYFLTNNPNCKGIIGSGNRNFGNQFLITPKRLSREFDIELIIEMEFQGIGREHEILNNKVKEMIN